MIEGAIRSTKGPGGVLSTEALNMLKVAKSGTRVSYLLKVKGPDNIVRNISGNFKIR